jgi:hypothetical protein
MKPVPHAANNAQLVLKVSMMSMMGIATTLIVACNRDGANPAGNSAALQLTKTASGASSPANSPVNASADSSPERHLADALANIWVLICKTRDGEKALGEWSHSQGDPDPAMNKSSARFKHALRILVGERSKTDSNTFTRAARFDLIVELLEKKQPEFGKRWHDGTFDPVLQEFGYGPIVNRAGNELLPDDEGPLTDGSMTADEAEKTVVGFCLLMDKEFLEPGLKVIDLEKQMDDRAGPEVERCFKEAFPVTLDEWLVGRGPADFDFVAGVRQALVRYHPDAAGPMAEFFAARKNRTVHYAQNEVKNQLTKIATAEQSFVDRLLGGDGIYWSADLAGLYRYQPNDSPIKMIDSELARLDAHPANLATESPLPPAPPPNEDYLPKFAFAAVRGANGAPLDAHHYAFCAWPLGYGRVGRQTYLLIDSGKIFVKDTEGKPVDRLPADLEADGWTSIDSNGGAPPRESAAAAPAAPTQAASTPVSPPVVAAGLLAPSSKLADPDPMVRINGLNRLMGVENENAAVSDDPAARQISPPAAKALAAMLADDNEFVRRRARQAVRFFGKPAIAEAKPVVLTCLHSEDSAMRCDALLAVKELTLRSEEFAAIIAKLASIEDHDECNNAFDALVIQSLDDETTRRLVKEAGLDIELGNVYPTAGVIHFLGSRGALAAASADELKEIANTPDPDLGPYRQEAAAEAYFHITGDASLYVALLHAQLKNSGFDRELMYKLAAVGPPAAAALPDLHDLYNNPTYVMHQPLLIYPMARITSNAAEAVTFLIPMLKDSGQRYDTLDVLEKFGPDAKAALSALQQLAATATGGEKEHFDRTIAAIQGTPVEDE